MKIHKRILCVLTALALLLPSFFSSGEISAAPMSDEWESIPSPAPAETAAENWYNPILLLGTEKQKRCFVIKTEFGGKYARLYISFPSFGGVRIENNPPEAEPEPVEKTAIFEPEAYIKINYSESGGKTVMRGTDGTSVLFSPHGDSWQFEISKNGGAALLLKPEQIYFGITDGEIVRTRLEMPLSEEEVIYGSGERYNGVNQNGKRSVMWNCDVCYHGKNVGADGIEELWRGYKNIPLLHSNAGYSLFYNSTCCAEFDIGYTDKSKYSLDFADNRLDVYLWTGAISENIVKYTDLTGKSYLPPKWAFQYQAGGSNGFWGNKKSDEYQLEQAKKLINSYAAMETPLKTVYLEGVNLLGENNAVAELFRQNNVRMLKWNNGDCVSLDEAEKLMPELKGNKLPLLKNSTNGSYYGQWIDFSDSDGTELLKRFLTRYTDIGIRGGMCDFAELIGINAVSPVSGLDGTRLHNFYTYGYAKGYNKAYSELTGNDFFCYIRGASAGTQSRAGLWAGDQYNSWAGLKMQLSAGLSAASCGFSIWGTDLCGLDGPLEDELFCRGLMMAAFSPIMRTGGNVSKLPTDYGATVCNTYKKAYWIRENLLNKLYSSAINSSKTGLPMMQAMAIAFQNDKNVAPIEEQYVFCDDFLVAPVLDKGAEKKNVVFPQGNWYDLWNGSKISGGEAKSVSCKTGEIPVYVKSGAAFPVTLGDSLNFGEKTGDNAKEVLLVTPPEGKRENTVNLDTSDIAVYTVSPLSDNCFTVRNADKNKAERVMVYGERLSGATIDGIPLNIIDGGSAETGIWYKSDSITVINLPSADWCELTLFYEKQYGDMHACDFNPGETAYFGGVSDNLTESDINDYFNISSANGVISYERTELNANPNALSVYKKAAFLYGDRYENFTLDFDCSFSPSRSGQQWIWITFGNKSRSTQNVSTGSSAIGIGINSNSSSAICTVRYKSSKTENKTFYGFDATSQHHIRVTLENGGPAVFIDGSCAAVFEVNGLYNGGYVGIGCNYSGTRISALTLDGNGYCYFGNVNKAGDSYKKQVDTKEYYDVSEIGGIKKYSYKKTTAVNWSSDAAMLNIGKAKNFSLDFDYKHTGNGERYLWLLWGTDAPGEYNAEVGACSLGIGARDSELKNGFLNCIYSDTVSAWFDAAGKGWLDSNKTLDGDFDATAEHHVSVNVQNGYITVVFDRGRLVKRRKWYSGYHGGYVMIGANYGGTEISNIEFSDCGEIGRDCFFGGLLSEKRRVGANEFYIKRADGSYQRSNAKSDCSDTGIPMLSAGEGNGFSLSFRLFLSPSEKGTQPIRLCSAEISGGKATAEGNIGISFSGCGSDSEVCIIKPDGTVTSLGATDSGNAIDICIVKSGNTLFVRVGDKGIYTDTEKWTGDSVLLGTDCVGVIFSDIELKNIFESETVFMTDGSTGERIEVPTEALYYADEKGNKLTRNGTATAENLIDGLTGYKAVGYGKDFYLEFDYRFPNNISDDRSYAWLLLGLPEPLSDGNAGSQVIGIGNNKYAQLCMLGQQAVWQYFGSYKTDGGHRAQISVIDGVLSIKVDGSLKKSVALSEKYVGGYVLLGLNRGGAEISNIYFEELNSSLGESFEAYFTQDLRNKTPEREAVGAHWRYSISRECLERTGTDYSDGNRFTNYSVLLYNKMRYYDFDMSIEYQLTNQGGIYIWLAAQPGKSWLGNDYAGSAIYIAPDGGTFLYENGLDSEILLGNAIFDDSAAKTKIHGCRIAVKAGRLSVTIDDKLICGNTALNGYDGGFIAVAANSEYIKIGNLNAADTLSATTLAELQKALLFGETSLQFDYNVDFKFNIIDLIRLKKLLAKF